MVESEGIGSEWGTCWCFGVGDGWGEGDGVGFGDGDGDGDGYGDLEEMGIMVDGIKLKGPVWNFPDYKDLVSKEDYEKYFKGREYKYDDPLTLALIRASDRVAVMLESDIGETLSNIEDSVGALADRGK